MKAQNEREMSESSQWLHYLLADFPNQVWRIIADRFKGCCSPEHLSQNLLNLMIKHICEPWHWWICFCLLCCFLSHRAVVQPNHLGCGGNDEILPSGLLCLCPWAMTFSCNASFPACQFLTSLEDLFSWNYEKLSYIPFSFLTRSCPPSLSKWDDNPVQSWTFFQAPE